MSKKETGLARGKFPPLHKIDKKNTALLIIDMQYLDAHWDYGDILKRRKEGYEKDMLYYKGRLQAIIPNIQRLQGKFREKGMEVIHARIQSLTMDGRDRSLMHKALKIFAPPGSKEAEILEEVKPVGDEIVLNKTTANVFSSTNIDYVLRNLGINCLIMVGVATNACIEGAARSACEKGYSVTLVDDACGTHSKEAHNSALVRLSRTYTVIMKTDEILETLDKL